MAEIMGVCHEEGFAKIGTQIRKAYEEFINYDELKCVTDEDLASLIQDMKNELNGMTDEDIASSILDIKITAVATKFQEDEPFHEALVHLSSGAVVGEPCGVVLTRAFWKAKNLLDALAESATAQKEEKTRRPALPFDYEEALSDECKTFDRGHTPYLYESMVATLGAAKETPGSIDQFVEGYIKKNVKKRPWLAGREDLIREMAEYAWSKCDRTKGRQPL